MGKTWKRGRNKSTGGQFVPISYFMAQSDAWRSLSGPAVKVYVELRRRFQMLSPTDSNNGDINLSMDEAVRLLSLGKATVSRALVELQEKGFIVKTKGGHWYGRMATKYAVTDRKLGDAPPTNAWQNWHPTSAEEKQKSVPTRNISADLCSATEPQGVGLVPLQNPSDHFSAPRSFRYRTVYTVSTRREGDTLNGAGNPPARPPSRAAAPPADANGDEERSVAETGPPDPPSPSTGKKSARPCEACGEPIPMLKRPGTRFCSGMCRKEAERRARRQRRA